MATWSNRRNDPAGRPVNDKSKTADKTGQDRRSDNDRGGRDRNDRPTGARPPGTTNTSSNNSGDSSGYNGSYNTGNTTRGGGESSWNDLGSPEFWLGSPSEFEVLPTSTLTEEQQRLLSTLINNGPQSYDIGGTSDLEAFRAMLEGKQAGQVDAARLSEASKKSQQAQQLFNAAGQPLSADEREEYYKTNIQDPAVTAAEEALSQIGRNFSAGGFYSSDRERADQDVADNLTELLTKERANFMLTQSQNDRAAQFQAAQGIAGIEDSIRQGDIQEMLNLTDASKTQAGLDTQFNIESSQQKLDALLGEQNARALQAQMDAESYNQLLQLLDVQAFENIVRDQEATPGAADAFLSGFGSSMSNLSDIRLKKNVVKIARLHPLVGIYTWDWRYPTMMGVAPTVGCIAQEVEEVMPRCVGLHHSGYKVINYAKLFEGVRAWQQ